MLHQFNVVYFFTAHFIIYKYKTYNRHIYIITNTSTNWHGYVATLLEFACRLYIKCLYVNRGLRCEKYNPKNKKSNTVLFYLVRKGSLCLTGDVLNHINIKIKHELCIPTFCLANCMVFCFALFSFPDISVHFFVGNNTVSMMLWLIVSPKYKMICNIFCKKNLYVNFSAVTKKLRCMHRFYERTVSFYLQIREKPNLRFGTQSSSNTV